MTTVQVGVIFFAVCLLTQVRGPFYHCLKRIFTKFRIYVDEMVEYYNYQNENCAFISLQ